MKRATLSCILLWLFTFTSYSQNEIKKVEGQLYNQLDSVANLSGWVLKKKKHHLYLEYADTFYRNSWMNPLYNHQGSLNQPDKLIVKIRLEENWTQKKSDSIKARNHKVLEPLIIRYNQELDSEDSRYRDYYRAEFKDLPYTFLCRWPKLSIEEKRSVENLVRLPDTVMGKVGVFVDPEYKPSNIYLEPDSVRDKVDASYNAFSKILGSDALFKREDPY